jgi:hypothetical protein
MKELNAYVKQQNSWNAIFKSRQYDLSNSADRQALAQKIDSDLSPENLSCDGELPRSQVQAKYRMLTKVAGQLLALDPSVQIYEFSE